MSRRGEECACKSAQHSGATPLQAISFGSRTSLLERNRANRPFDSFELSVMQFSCRSLWGKNGSIDSLDCTRGVDDTLARRLRRGGWGRRGGPREGGGAHG